VICIPNVFALHIWALILGFALDLIVGDPEWFPHPVRFIGRFIIFMESVLRKRMKNLRAAAPILTASTVIVTMAITALALFLLSLIHWIALLVGMALVSWMCLSVKNLADEARGVARALRNGLEAGRKQVARIVGRDTAALQEEEIIRATVETVSENTIDGVISPLIYLALGGPVLAMGFKAASTLDSMIGYMNDKYRDLGWASARLDDVLNYLPARVGSFLMCIVAPMLGMNGKEAFHILKRDHANHKSPNCAWPESAAAGAIGIQLGGAHSYFGKIVDKPTIGNDLRGPKISDIGKANRLLYASSILAISLAVLVYLLLR